MQLMEERLAAIRQMPELLPPEERRKLDIKQARKGSYVRVDGDVYRVETRHRYSDSEGYQWFELVLYSLDDCTQHYLEWEVDDELEVSMTVKELSLDDIGVTAADLEKIDDEESGRLTFESQTFQYTESDKATFFRDEAGDGEEFYYWDFDSQDAGSSLSVERWKNKWQVWLSVPVKTGSIEILYEGENS